MDTLAGAWAVVQTVFVGGTLGALTKLAVLIGGGIFVFIIGKFLSQLQIEQADKETQEQRLKDQIDIGQNVKNTGAAAVSGESKTDAVLEDSIKQ